jgi:hypothetical protein
MRKTIITCLLGGILGISLASGGISIDTWEFWSVWTCVLGLCLNFEHD